MNSLLTVKDLSISFPAEGRRFNAVDGVSFSLQKGETLGLVGESGCGKSVTSLSLLRMIDDPGRIESGEITFNGNNLMQLSNAEMRRIRGNEISMVFQEPMNSLNPVFTVGNQIAEVLRIHQKLSRSEAYDKAVEMLKLVNLSSPEKRVKEYPHQLSGGMRQRVMIAMALACRPQVLIADEPTTALDVTIQAQILALMSRLQQELGMSILFITHDLGVVAELCSRVLVMYAGKIVETGLVQDVFKNPRHPYTKGLLASIPRLEGRQDKLPTIRGSIPSLSNIPKGCRFSNRCPYAQKICSEKEPILETISEGRSVSCWFHEDIQKHSQK